MQLIVRGFAAAAGEKIADDAIKVQFSVTPIYFLAHVINCTITYLFIIKFSGSQRCGEMEKDSEVYDEYLHYKDTHFDCAIACALKERRFDDAKALKLEKANPKYETSVSLTNETRLRMEALVNLLTDRYNDVADAVEIEDCEICDHRLIIMKRILRQNVL